MSWALLLLLTLQFSSGFSTTCTYFDTATPDAQTQTGCTWRTYGDQNDFVHCTTSCFLYISPSSC